MPKIFSDLGKLSIARNMLMSSVFIALLTTLNTTALAQPVTAPQPTPPATPSTTPSAIDQPKNPISQKLLGQWETKDPGLAISLTFIFSPEGKLFIFSPSSQSTVAVEFKYRINPTPQPMHLDITIPNKKDPVLTIFDFTADGQLRLQLDNTDPGKPRPSAFSQTPALFTKISETTKLPENIKVIEPNL